MSVPAAEPTQPQSTKGLDDLPAPPGVDVTKPSIARVYDYLLGGTANYEVDRKTAEYLLEVVKDLKLAAWAGRGFLQRVTTWMARQGVRQFIDIGAGLPTQNNTHDVAQEVDPSCRVVYVDNDPTAVTHGMNLVANVDYTYYVSGELKDPEGILDDPVIRKTIDFDQPVGLLIISTVYNLSDADDPWGKVATLMDALPPGSYLALNHLTNEKVNPDVVERITEGRYGAKVYDRSRAEIRRFFDGLEIVPPYPGGDPDLVYIGVWGSENPTDADDDSGRLGLAAVARKPEPQADQ